MPQCVGHDSHLFVKRDIMNTEDMCRRSDGLGVDHRRADFTIRDLPVQNGSNETFAGRPENNRPVQSMQKLEMSHDPHIVGNSFAEANAWIHHDLTAIHPVLLSVLNPLLQEGDDL
jgi:hypothetical protein